MELWKRFSQSSKYSQATATSEKVTVTLENTDVELKQTTRTKFVISGLSGEIALGDVAVQELVKVANGTDKIDYLIKSVTMSDDKKSATVELFYEFNDGGEYEVTVKGYDVQTLIASKGAPKIIVLHSAKDNISDRSVVIDTYTSIWATFYDENNVDVTNDELRGSLTYVIKYADSSYENMDTFLYFAEVGERAVVTAEYHTYEYDEQGNEKNAMTSTPYTFYAVAKGEELITGITDYTTTGNYYSSDKKVVKMGDTRNLSIKIKTKDYPNNEVVLNEFNQEVKNYGETVTFGTVQFTSLNPDILEVYPNGTSVGLYPRQIGTARVMVSYKLVINGVEVNTPIGAVSIEVKDTPKLDSISLDVSNIVFCVDPADNYNSSKVENPTYTLTVKDQYGNEYSDYSVATNGYINGFKGLNTLGSAAIKADAISFADGVITLTSRAYEALMDDLTATRFSFSFAVQDNNNTSIVKSVNFTADARKAEETINEKNVLFDVNVGTIQWNGNNVARFYTDNSDYASECVKSATIMVYQLSNGAKYDEIALLGKAPTDAELKITAVSDGYYFLINKNGKDITDNHYKTDIKEIYSQTLQSDAYMVNLAMSNTKTSDYDSDRTIVTSTSDTGAGTYEFILYRIVDNKKSRVSSKTITTTWNQGSYSFVSRDEISAASANQEDLIKCFTIKDKDGNVVSHKDTDITATTIKFGNYVRNYKVVLNEERTTASTVFVEKIVVWEDVSCWGNNGYAEYTVDVNCFVSIPQ